MAAHVKEMPKPPIELLPSLPPALNEIILMAISKDPGTRFQTANAFRNALSSVRAAVPLAQAAVTPDSAVTAATLSVKAIADSSVAPARSTNPVAAAPTTPPAVLNVPSVLASSPPQGHRGLYMTLGALIVLAVLVVAGIYVPRRSKTQARSSATPTTPSTQTPDAGQQSAIRAPQPPSAVTPPTEARQSAQSGGVVFPAGGTAPSGSGQTESSPAASAAASSQMQQQIPMAAIREAEKSSASHRTAASAKSLMPQPKAASAAPPTDTEVATSENAAASNAPDTTSTTTDLDELEREVDQVSNRAAAVDNSLQRLQQQQAASGLGLRGDMAARQASMKTNFSRASEAVQHGDVARAKKYMKLAVADIEVLERFLGH
jgi:eukaryotic-like serine/threonine-protein kinase